MELIILNNLYSIMLDLNMSPLKINFTQFNYILNAIYIYLKFVDSKINQIKRFQD